MKKVLKEKAGVDLGEDYEKEVEKKGYIPFNIQNYSSTKTAPDNQLQEITTEEATVQAAAIDYDVIPISVWVYRRDDGSGATATPAEVETFFDEVRAIFEPTGIKVYMLCGINYVNSTQFYTLSRAEYEAMITTNRVAGNLNVH